MYGNKGWSPPDDDWREYDPERGDFVDQLQETMPEQAISCECEKRHFPLNNIVVTVENDVESRAIQEFCFNVGVFWRSGVRNRFDITTPASIAIGKFNSDDICLTFGYKQHKDGFFDDHKWMTASEFLETKWQTLPGEEQS